jgi:BirA family biotin operon repressor/biotin-[acetyl-CoA-carboxylase] ligase
VRAATRVLEILYDARESFVEMAELRKSVAGRPGSVNAAIEELRAAGQSIEVSPGHGVRLIKPARLDSHLIERGLGTSRVGRSVICFPEVDSTNDVAFEAAREKNSDGLVVLAEHQRRGRGRQGRKWVSPPGANIMMSALLIDARLPHEAVTIAAGLAVAEGVEAACGAACSLYWPNDVCIDGRKLSGVLVEVRKRASRRCVIVGIGINVNASPPRQLVDRPATDLASQAGSPVERTEVVRAVLRRLDHWAGAIADGQISQLRDGWVARCGILNHRLSVLCEGRKYEGRVLDVSPLEGLVLRCDHDVTVRLPAQTSSIIH